MRNLLGYFAVTALLLLGAAGAVLYLHTAETPVLPAWSDGDIRVGYSSEPPYSYRTPDGVIAGAGPETAKAVLEMAGIGPVHWVLLDFSQAIGALGDGRIDMIANGLFITPERARQVLFSQPYCLTRQGLLVRRGNPLDLHSYAAVAQNAAVTVAVLDGAVEQQTMLRLGVSPDRLFVVPDPAGGLAAVRKGRADCLALSAPSVAWLAGEGAGAVEVAAPFWPEPGEPPGQSAFAFRLADRGLVGRVDAALTRYRATSHYRERMRQLGFGREDAQPGS